MRSVISIFANGGGFLAFWQRIPNLIKWPFIIGLLLTTGAELNSILNNSLRSSRVEEGKAVEADSKIADPNATKAAVAAGRPVTGAERTISAQVAGLDADAQEKQARADAASASEEDLMDRARRGLKLTSTDKLRLRELQLKERELAIREQEVHIKAAEASAADSSAAVKNWINNSILGRDDEAECARISALSGCVDSNGLDRFGRLAARAQGRNAGISDFTQREFDKSMARTFGTPLRGQATNGGGNLARRMMDATARRTPGLESLAEQPAPEPRRRDPGGDYYRRMLKAADDAATPQPQPIDGGKLVDRVLKNGAFKRRDPGDTVRNLEGRISDPFE